MNRKATSFSRRGIPLEVRIADYTAAPNERGCAEWTSSKDRDGYGQIQHQGKCVRVTRWLWEREHGPIPPGMQVCHTCDNPPCCTVAHFFLGTNLENTLDKIRKGRQTRGEQNGGAKLTDEQVLALLRDVRAHRVVAADYRVAMSLIWAIRKRRRWAHIAPGEAPAWRPLRSRYDVPQECAT